MNNFQENIFYHYILLNRQLLEHTNSLFFSTPILQGLFEIAKTHVKSFDAPPTATQMKELINVAGKHNISVDMVDLIYTVQLHEYDPEWLKTNATSWIKMKNLTKVIERSISLLKTTDLTADNIPNVVETVRNMIYTETAMDFNFVEGSDFFDVSSHTENTLERYTTGYPFMDIVLKGGYYKGGLHMLQGAPKSGKSWWLYNLAANIVLSGRNVAIITLEMAEVMVNMRVGCNLLNILLDDYETISKNKDIMKEKLISLKRNSAVPPGNLYIKEFPTSTLSVPDLENHLVKYEQNHQMKFDFIIVDYLNIMHDIKNPKGDNLYLKIKNISEGLRGLAKKQEWGIISATQTSKGGWNSTDSTTQNTSESSALIQTVDSLFAIICTDEMKSRSEYYLKCLCNRGGGMENYRKKFNFVLRYGRIVEDNMSSFFLTDDLSVKPIEEQKQVEIPQNVSEIGIFQNLSVGTEVDTQKVFNQAFTNS